MTTENSKMENINKGTFIEQSSDPIFLENEKIYGNKSCYKCNFCHQKGVKANIKIHQLTCDYRAVAQPYSTYCEECMLIFWYYRAYKQHCDQNVKCKNAKRLYVCDVCNWIFANKAGFERHCVKNSHSSKYTGKQQKRVVGHVKTIDFELDSTPSSPTKDIDTLHTNVIADITLEADPFATTNNSESVLTDEKPAGGQEGAHNCMLTRQVNLYRPMPSDKEKIMVLPDTNIFISGLYRIEAILHRYRKADDRVIVLLPYEVLKELDRLKHQRGTNNVSAEAKFAIKSIHEDFIQYPEKFKCQGAIQHTNYLIDITNADDKIFNFCLQVQPHAEHVILVSNDVNLQNKATGTAIESTKDTEIKHRLIELCGH